MKIETAIASASFRELGTEIISGLKPGQQFELRTEPQKAPKHLRNSPLNLELAGPKFT